MIIEKILGNIRDMNYTEGCPGIIDRVPIEWYEVHKKTLRKISRQGLEVGIRRQEGTPLQDGDILWQEGSHLLVVEIAKCECLALKPATMLEMAEACYAIGNRHAPLFFEEGELLTPYDEPLMTALARLDLPNYRKTARLTRSIGGSNGGHVHSH